MAIPKGPYDDKVTEAMDWLRMKDKSKYYDVESGEERSWSHGPECPCPSCSKSRLRSVIDDVIKAKGAFAPASKKHKTKSYGAGGGGGGGAFARGGAGGSSSTTTGAGGSSPRHDWFGDTYSAHTEPTETDEGKCFGWQPEGANQIWEVEYDDLHDNKFREKEVYMSLTDKPMSPDMTRNDTAVMSVDQQRACLTLKVTYNPFFNERMKKSIESKYRNWNPTTKTWEFHPSMMKQIQQICGEFYKGVQIIGQKPVLGTKFEKLLSKLTKDDKQSIYRLMALKYHPDKGGDHETMSLLNEVFKQ